MQCTVSVGEKDCHLNQGQNKSYGECDFNPDITFDDKSCNVTVKGLQAEALLSVKISQQSGAAKVKTHLKKIVEVKEEDITVSYNGDEVRENEVLSVTCKVSASGQPRPETPTMMLMKDDENVLPGSEALFSDPLATTDDGEAHIYTFNFTSPKFADHQGMFPCCKVEQDQVGNFSKVSNILIIPITLVYLSFRKLTKPLTLSSSQQ